MMRKILLLVVVAALLGSIVSGTTITVSGSGLVATYIGTSGGYETWKVMTTGSHDGGQTTGTVTINSVDYSLSVIAAGGSGGTGGGGGGEIKNLLSQTNSSTFNIAIGHGGHSTSYGSGQNGGNTYFYAATATVSDHGDAGGNPSGGPGGGSPVVGGPGSSYASALPGYNATIAAVDGNNYAGGGGAGYTGTNGGPGGGGKGSSSIGAPDGDPATENTGSAGGGSYGTGTDRGGDGANGLLIIRAAPSANPPVAAFHASPLVVWRNGTIQFTDDTTNTPTSWSWYDPDTANPLFTGNLSNQNPQVFPRTWGYHSVNLIACNGAGCSTKASGARYLYVLPPGVI